MSDLTLETIDPRIRRTRHLLHEGLSKLLEEKDFDSISVHEIADAATVNRATFYDHYPDKFALLECTVASRFHQLLDRRRIHFDGTCPTALLSLITALCDYLDQMHVADSRRSLQPHMESALIAVVRRMILDGIRRHNELNPRPAAANPHPSGISPEILASTVSWAIYGAAKEWLQSTLRPPSTEAAKTILTLVNPIFQAA